MEGKNRKKFLYIMGTDWNWIFQRPQIIALHLEQEYDVTVVFPRSIRALTAKQLNELPPDYRIIHLIPFQERTAILEGAARFFIKEIFKDIAKYDAIWIGYPLYYRYIPENYSGKIIYDCMDNHTALFPLKKRLFKLTEQENKLIQRSDVLLASGTELQRKLSKCADRRSAEISLLRNGTDMGVQVAVDSAQKRSAYKIGYFGTIAEWFDFNTLLRSLEECPSIEYHLIGPIAGTEVPQHERIYTEGVVAHEKLAEATKDYACLCMPFIVNDIVRYVDPVKLYEYISLGKCIISVWYEEIERFEDYVYMYKNADDYVNLLKNLIRDGFPPKYNAAQQIAFLNENSWEQRFKTLDEVMESLWE